MGLKLQEIGLEALEQDIDRLDASTAASLAREMGALDRRATGLADTLASEKEASTAILMNRLRRRSVWQALLPEDTLFIHTVMALQYGLPTKRELLASSRAYLDAGIKDARRPYYARVLPPWVGINQLIAQDLSLPRLKWAVRDARWRIIELRLAARAYQVEHGAPPASARLLVPASLPAVLRDPFADRLLVYRVKGNRAVVYSRGPDGKDDGGKDLGNRVYPGMSGDIVTLKDPTRTGTGVSGSGR